MVSYKEGPHPQAFILDEANGQRSRDNVAVAEGQEFPPGTVLVIAGGEATVWASGGGNLAIAMYGAKREAGADPVSISVIARDAEVNRWAMAWPDGTDDAAVAAAATELAKQGIIVRGVPWDQMGGLPSPLAAEASSPDA
jgi:head decoration protein D